MRLRRVSCRTFAAILSCELLAAALRSSGTAGDEAGWPMHGGVDNIRYSPLAQVSRDNVTKLHVAWTYDSHDAFKGSEMQSNPVVVDGVLYATTPALKVIALDAATGHERWRFDPAAGSAGGARFRHRGVTVHNDRVFVTYRNFLWALDRRSGAPISSFGTGGRVDLREGLDQPAEKLTVSASTPGVVFEDLLIMGSTVPETLPGTPGHIRAFDINSGKVRWVFHTIPKPGEFGYETWPKNAYTIAGGANAWAGVTSIRRTRWCLPPPDRRPSTSTVCPGTETTCSPTVCSRSTPGPGAASGTFKASGTTSGTGISPPPRISSPSLDRVAGSKPSRRSRSTDTSTCSSGEPANRSFRLNIGRSRRQPWTANCWQSGSRIR